MMKKCASIALLFLFACGGNSGQPSTIASQRQATVAECPNGGVVIEYGIDDDGDGQLDPNEVDGSEVVCHGADGDNGRDTLVSVDVEPPGANCPTGGSAMKTGLDLDGDGVLDPTEATSTTYLCNGTDGSTGTASLVELSEASESECPNGGTVIEAGLDSDGDGVLDPSEVTSTDYVCDGTDGTDGTDGSTGAVGLTSLIDFRDDTTTSTCPNGGTVVDTGLDLDGDGVLDPAEVTSTSYLCDAVDGTDGSTGARSLLEIREGASGCPSGGVLVEAGVDLDDDGVLDPDEIESTAQICNGTSGSTGAEGLSSLIEVSIETPGANCPNGGSRISAGLDLDSDGALDPTEITSIAFACTGTDGSIVVEDASSLVEITGEPAGVNCPYGGVQVSAGLDADGDGVLDPGEVTSTEYVCDGIITGPTGVLVGNFTISGPFEAAYIARVTEITGDLFIEGTAVTSNISLPLLTRIGGELRITGAQNLQTLELDSLTQIGSAGGQISQLRIVDAPQLSTFNAPNLSTIGNLYVQGCGLTDFSGIGGVTSFGPVMHIDCSLTSLAGLEGVTSLENLYISGGPASLSGLDNLTSITRNLEVYQSYSLRDFTGLHSLTSIGGDVIIEDNDSLRDFTGLQSLASIGGDVDILDNLDLRTFTGFNASVGGTLFIDDNARLNSLTGLEAHTSFSQLEILNNGRLASLGGLTGLTSVGRLTVFNNNNLLSLDLVNLTTANIITIRGNRALPTCHAVNLVNQCVPTPSYTIEGNDDTGTCP